MLGSTLLGKYSNYLLITTYVTSFISLITGGIRGSIGNSIAKENVDKNYKLFKKLNFLYMWIVSFCTICIFALSDSFIDVVLTKNDSVDLLLNRNLLILISLNFFFTTSRYMCGTFKECAGIFYADRYKSLFESIINLIVSVVLCYFIGLPGVVIGTIVSNITTSIWIEPYVLNKYYFKKSTLKYFANYVIYLILTILIGMFTMFVCNKIPSTGIATLIAKFALCAILPNILLLISLCWHPEFKECLEFVKNLINKVFKRKSKKTLVVLQTGNKIDIDSNGIPDVNKDVIIINKNESD
jgi:Na+-driven multidrug efflux pump